MASPVAARLARALERQGIPIVTVSLGVEADRLTWTLQFAPTATALQRLDAQALLDAYDPSAPDPTFDDEQDTRDVTAALDQQRLHSAVVWAILDTYSAPATRTKYLAARTKIMNAYKSSPWKA